MDGRTEFVVQELELVAMKATQASETVEDKLATLAKSFYEMYLQKQMQQGARYVGPDWDERRRAHLQPMTLVYEWLFSGWRERPLPDHEYLDLL